MVRWRSCVKVWIWKSELPQGNFLYSLTKPEITRQRSIKDELSRMGHIDYNTAMGRNVMNVDDIEDF